MSVRREILDHTVPDTQTVTVGPIDVALLREQRDWLLDTLDTWEKDDPRKALPEGLLEFLDHALDVGEGFAKQTQRPR